jgi:AmmeMemoRadiSam system radical SAM enzyme
MDAANIDLKGFSERFYKDLCSGRLAAVLETLEYLKHETEVWFEITTLLIPGENDSPAEIEAESVWLLNHLGPDVPLHFTAFHPDWKMMDRPPTPPETLRTGEADSTQRRSSLRLYRQYSRSGRAIDFLPRLQHGVGRPEWVSHHRMALVSGRSLPRLRDSLPRRL